MFEIFLEKIGITTPAVAGIKHNTFCFVIMTLVS